MRKAAVALTLCESTLPLLSEEDILRVRHTVRDWLIEHKFSLIQQTKMVTASSELSRNTVIHGGGGRAILQQFQHIDSLGLKVTFEDQGPGIADIEQALRNGYTTGGGLGLWLGGAKRLVQDFQIHSQVGLGTHVSISIWK
jgi:serine/threonine-protein kinase RsbT